MELLQIYYCERKARKVTESQSSTVILNYCRTTEAIMETPTYDCLDMEEKLNLCHLSHFQLVCLLLSAKRRLIPEATSMMPMTENNFQDDPSGSSNGVYEINIQRKISRIPWTAWLHLCKFLQSKTGNYQHITGKLFFLILASKVSIYKHVVKAI